MNGPAAMSHSSHEEIARLAYLNWQRDGSPYGRDQNYWLEAERQLHATTQLLARASNGRNARAATSVPSRPGSRSKAGAMRLAQ